jgi:hypothetical protein
MTIATGTLTMASTNVIEISRLKDTAAVFLSTATGTLNLYDASAVPVSGAQGIAMSYTAGTGTKPGKYRGTIPSTVTLTEGQVYDGQVTMTATDGSVRLFHIALTAERG